MENVHTFADHFGTPTGLFAAELVCDGVGWGSSHIRGHVCVQTFGPFREGTILDYTANF